MDRVGDSVVEKRKGKSFSEDFEELLQKLGSEEDDNDEGGSTTLISIRRKPTKFDKLVMDITKFVCDVKSGQKMTDQDCDNALAILDKIKNTHHDLQQLTSTLSKEIFELKGKIDAETKVREETNQLMLSKIDELELSNKTLYNEYNNMKNVMLVRALATSFQFSLTKLFPGLFTSRYAFSCTFDDVQAKVEKKKNPIFDQELTAVVKLFQEKGVEKEDVPLLIKTIRELGTEHSHVTTVKDGEIERKATAADIELAITNADIDATIKSDAKILLSVLEMIVPAGHDLLYR